MDYNYSNDIDSLTTFDTFLIPDLLPHVVSYVDAYPPSPTSFCLNPSSDPLLNIGISS